LSEHLCVCGMKAGHTLPLALAVLVGAIGQSGVLGKLLTGSLNRAIR